jgi:hypothetical protein
MTPKQPPMNAKTSKLLRQFSKKVNLASGPVKEHYLRQPPAVRAVLRRDARRMIQG